MPLQLKKPLTVAKSQGFMKSKVNGFHSASAAASLVSKNRTFKSAVKRVQPLNGPAIDLRARLRVLGQIATRNAASFCSSTADFLENREFDVHSSDALLLRLQRQPHLSHFDIRCRKALQCDVNPSSAPLTIFGGLSLSLFVNMISREKKLLDALFEAWSKILPGTQYPVTQLDALARLSQEFKQWAMETEVTAARLKSEYESSQKHIEMLKERNTLLEKVSENHQHVLHRLRSENEELHDEINRLKVLIRRLGGDTEPINWANFYAAAAR